MNQSKALNQMSVDVRAFLEGLLKDADILVIPPQIREQMILDLSKRLDLKLTIAAMDALPKDEIAGFEALLAQKVNTKELSRFLEKNVPDIGKVYADALFEFRQSYLAQH